MKEYVENEIILNNNNYPTIFEDKEKVETITLENLDESMPEMKKSKSALSF